MVNQWTTRRRKNGLNKMIKEKLTEDNNIYKCRAPTDLTVLLINGTAIHFFFLN